VSRGRFALLVTLVAMLAGVGAFAVGLQVLDDGEPDAPPSEAAAGDDATTTVPPPISPTTTAPTTPPGALETPAWITVVASEGSEAEAEADAARVAAAGHPAGVLRSDDYETLKPDLWVAYAGPYPDRAAAEAAIASLEADGFAGTYVRCAGTKDACKGGDEDDDD
jgi:cell division septation protein DedD